MQPPAELPSLSRTLPLRASNTRMRRLCDKSVHLVDAAPHSTVGVFIGAALTTGVAFGVAGWWATNRLQLVAFLKTATMNAANLAKSAAEVHSALHCSTQPRPRALRGAPALTT